MLEHNLRCSCLTKLASRTKRKDDVNAAARFLLRFVLEDPLACTSRSRARLSMLKPLQRVAVSARVGGYGRNMVRDDGAR